MTYIPASTFFGLPIGPDSLLCDICNKRSTVGSALDAWGVKTEVLQSAQGGGARVTLHACADCMPIAGFSIIRTY